MPGSGPGDATSNILTVHGWGQNMGRCVTTAASHPSGPHPLPEQSLGKPVGLGSAGAHPPEYRPQETVCFPGSKAKREPHPHSRGLGRTRQDREKKVLGITKGLREGRGERSRQTTQTSVIIICEDLHKSQNYVPSSDPSVLGALKEAATS